MIYKCPTHQLNEDMDVDCDGCAREAKEFERLPSWDEDPNTRIYWFETGGTSCLNIAGEKDDGSDFERAFIGLHVYGKSVEHSVIVDHGAKTIVVFDLEDAETLCLNLIQTIQDFKTKNAGVQPGGGN